MASKEEQTSIMIAKPVLTKRDFVRRYKQGEFGNHTRTWNNLDEMEDDGTIAGLRNDQLFHIRNRVAGDVTWFNVQGDELEMMWEKACLERHRSNLYVSEMASTAHTVLQGELMNHYQGGGFDLFASTVKEPMRGSLRKGGTRYQRSQVMPILQTYLPQRDLQWLMYLVETYPDHVIEFSTYSKTFGTVPGFRTAYWEVRRY